MTATRGLTKCYTFLLAIAICLAGRQAAAQTLTTWTNVVPGSTVTGSWSTAANWDAGVPNANTGNLTSTVGSYVVNDDSPANAFRVLVLSNSASQTATLNINAAGFTVTSNLVLGTGGVINVNASGAMLVSNLTGNVAGTLNINSGGQVMWANSSTRPNFGTRVTVGTGGLFVLLNDVYNLNNGGSVLVAAGGIWTNAGSLATGQGTLGTLTNRGTMIFNNTLAGLTIGNEGPGVMSMESGLIYQGKANRSVAIGSVSAGNNATGRVYFTGGIVTNLGTLSVGLVSYSAGRSCSGELQIGGGVWNTGPSNVLIGGYAPSWTTGAPTNNYISVQGVLTQTAGVFRAQGSVYVANGPSKGTLTVQGGSFEASNVTSSAALIVGAMAGTLVTNAGLGTFTLGGGTATVDRLVATNGPLYSVIAFNGGTLASKSTAIANGSTFKIGDGTNAATWLPGGGAHTLADGLTVSTNATLSFSNSTGTLTTANLTLQNGSTSVFSVASSTAFGRIVVASNTVLGGTLNLSFTYAPTIGTTYQLFTWGAGTKTGAFAARTVSGLANNEVVDYSAFDANGTITIAKLRGATTFLLR